MSGNLEHGDSGQAPEDKIDRIKRLSPARQRRQQNSADQMVMPIGLRIALFQHWYPALWTSPEYSTPDHIIPVKHFDFYFRAMHGVRAFLHLDRAHAVNLGYRMAKASDEDMHKIEQQHAALRDEAFGIQR